MELLPHTGPSLAPSSRPDQGMRTAAPWQYSVSAAGFGACAAGVDLVLDDGTRLSGTTLADQYGFGAGAHGEAKGLVPDQGNIRTIDIALAGLQMENK
jgi:hypothetical protein